MTADEYWAKLKSMGIVRTTRFSPTRWRGRSREEDPIFIEDPSGYPEDQLDVMVEEYRLRYCRFDA